MEIINREAKYNYFIEEEFECGIVLVGTEIKSIRDGKANLKDMETGEEKEVELNSDDIIKYL